MQQTAVYHNEYNGYINISDCGYFTVYLYVSITQVALIKNLLTLLNHWHIICPNTEIIINITQSQIYLHLILIINVYNSIETEFSSFILMYY